MKYLLLLLSCVFSFTVQAEEYKSPLIFYYEINTFSGYPPIGVNPPIKIPFTVYQNMFAKCEFNVLMCHPKVDPKEVYWGECNNPSKEFLSHYKTIQYPDYSNFKGYKNYSTLKKLSF